MTDSKPFIYRFEDFEVREREFLLSRAGEALSVEPKAFRVLLVLLRTPRRLVSKEELLDAVWNDCNVSENSLARSVARLRSTLGDDPREPRYIATVPTVGYRFVCEVERTEEADITYDVTDDPTVDARKGEGQTTKLTIGTGSKTDFGRSRLRIASWVLLPLAVAIFAFWLVSSILRPRPVPAVQRTLTRLTYYDGLQIDASWSPDGQYFAYSADRGGKFDVWVQQATGGDPVQVTHGPGHNWQPEWSPDGRYIAYRSEAGEGGIFAVPPLGGAGQMIKLSAFGYYPHWSPDSKQILFQTAPIAGDSRLFVTSFDSGEPSEVLRDFVVEHDGGVMSAIWHPDGKRISIWLWQPSLGPSIWTVPLFGGTAKLTAIPPEASRQLGEWSRSEFADDFRFSWSPRADAVYFELTLTGTKNIWKLRVDPKTLEGTALERLTTGQGPDAGPFVSPNGEQMLFTALSRKVQAWVFPLDADRGRIIGAGTPTISASMDGWHPSLTRDGSQLIVNAQRGGEQQLWRKTLPDGAESPLMSDSFARSFPQWSPDGRHLVYARHERSSRENRFMEWAGRLMVWSAEDGQETPLTDPDQAMMAATDWSADGQAILVWKLNDQTGRTEVWALPVSAAPHAQSSARRLLSDPAYDIYQAHFSPDGKWIVFEAVKQHSNKDESTIYVVHATGGTWTRITDGKQWDDKPRWSPNGKLVYFLSDRGGFLNVWSSHFDPVRGTPIGPPAPVTSFGNPSLMVPTNISPVEISISKNKLALTLARMSGNIWVVGRVDR